MLGLLFAGVALLLGWAACRWLGIGFALAPAVGLALLAVAASWAMVVGLALTPAVLGVTVLAVIAALRRPGGSGFKQLDAWTASLLAVAALLPVVVLGAAFAGLDVPSNNHDGIFHVELVDALRGGAHFDTWYPRGYHAAVAAVLGLAPGVDSARGTAEASEGLAVLGALAVYGLGQALGARPRVAAMAATIQALTFIYPYDYHIWGGWPLGMGVVLLVGVWTAALKWIERPSLVLAASVGLLAAGILFTHGTEVYTASVGLLAILLVRGRRVQWRALLKHAPVAAGLSLALAAPYVPVLLGWARVGGAVDVANASHEFDVLNPALQGGGIWVQIGLGAIGAVGFVDLPVRAGLIVLGMCEAWAGLTRGMWIVFVGLLLLFALPEHPLLVRVFAVTYPWLADQRLLQVASILASLLAAGGLGAAIAWLARNRARSAATHPRTARRLIVAAALVTAFVAEGSLVSIYKSLSAAATSEGSFSADDRLAMAWVRQDARAGDTLANDASVDAGIWAPYKAGVRILLPRAGLDTDSASRQMVRDNIANLQAMPSAETAACLLGLRYVYYGARVYADEVHRFPPPVVLAGAPGLEEVFRSGDAVVFKTRLTCG